MKNLLKKVVLGVLLVLAYPMAHDLFTTYVLGEDEREFNNLESGAIDCQDEFSADMALLIQYAQSLGFKVGAGETWRTRYQQKHNIALGVSWTMNSLHLKRRAIDLNLFNTRGKYLTTKEAYLMLGEFWEMLNSQNVWGGRWKHTPDIFHFERRRCSKVTNSDQEIEEEIEEEF